MTRSNVYAGPAGFWLVRGRPGMEVQDHDAVFRFSKQGAHKPARLPGPAAARGQTVLELNLPDSPIRTSVREIPIAIQDRTFRADGSLFYPDNRAFFEELNVEGTAGTPAAQFPGQPELQVDFVPDSDIAPIWNPEAFFNVMVVNGVSWPSLRVAPAKYRFRLLNGCNSRFLNLALVYPEEDGEMAELPFVQIGAEQGFLPQPAEVLTGFATPITDGKKPRKQDRVPAAHPQQALLMTLAERADVIVDFGNLPDGTVVRMINTAPDAPFGGFPDEPADPDSTGQVMQFVVDHALWLPSDDDATNPYQLVLNAEPPVADPVAVTRQVSLNEEESEEVCIEVDANGNVVQVPGSYPEDCLFDDDEIFGPKEALLGLVDLGGAIPEDRAQVDRHHRGQYTRECHAAERRHGHGKRFGESAPRQHRGVGDLQLHRGCAPDPPPPGAIPGDRARGDSRLRSRGPRGATLGGRIQGYRDRLSRRDHDRARHLRHRGLVRVALPHRGA
jgi:hypothetical protein